ncbi:hypothetical protein, partial [Streptomyces sp. NPDC048417]|uniref:hypothetical protein n=1 Tax=Streptomyces sp. NPDC048417 TaxID=3155387 RepID=UPI00342E7E1C
PTSQQRLVATRVDTPPPASSSAHRPASEIDDKNANDRTLRARERRGAFAECADRKNALRCINRAAFENCARQLAPILLRGRRRAASAATARLAFANARRALRRAEDSRRSEKII